MVSAACGERKTISEVLLGCAVLCCAVLCCAPLESRTSESSTLPNLQPSKAVFRADLQSSICGMTTVSV
eukprot:1842583-Lingulodinium_polyedra.AAC.1